MVGERNMMKRSVFSVGSSFEITVVGSRGSECIISCHWCNANLGLSESAAEMASNKACLE